MNIHFRTALGYVRRSPFQALAAIFVLTLTFFVATVVALMTYSSTKLILYYETRPQIIAFLKDNVSETEISTLQHKLSTDDRIKEVNYVTKEQALSIYKKATSDNPLLGELVSPSIFPASLEFSTKNLTFVQNVIDEVKKEKIVDSVGFTASLQGENSLKDVVGRLKTLANNIRIIGSIFIGILAMASFTVLLIVISMRITTRRDEVEILNLLGATPGFVRSPIVLEALIYSVIGVFVGWITVFVIFLYVTPSWMGYFEGIQILPKDTLGVIEMFLSILGIELFLGFVLGLGGSLLAVSRVKNSR